MTVEIILKGRVQGVGCRYYCGQVARAMKLSGSATNQYDGSVRILLHVENIDMAEKFCSNLRRNTFGYNFWGSFTSIEIRGSVNEEINGDYLWK